MTFFSRRKEDPRAPWNNDEKTVNEGSVDDGLAIPPCDIWHDDAPAQQTVTGELPPAPQDPIPPQDGSQCWAFMGAVGGVGTTTLAVQMAYELAKTQASKTPRGQRNTDPKVCLIDLDFEASGIVHHLDVQAGLSQDDLAGDPARIDSLYIQSLLSHHSSGMSVLAAPNMINGNAGVNPLTVLALLDAVCDAFPYVILDVPRHWQPWTAPALMGADFLGLVTELSIPSLHMTRAKCDQLSDMLGSQSSCHIIMNKFERRAFKSTLRLSDAETALQRTVLSTLCMDPDVTREASNCGTPVGHVRTDSRYAKDSRKLLELMTNKVSTDRQNINKYNTVAA
ncbi:CpaE family protein [Fretibacter rubidus]|uniref:AAA family ATPase n=1 Tax=Fretibacter rubidus TaxID=570162 RepID=UPI00352B1C29